MEQIKSACPNNRCQPFGSEIIKCMLRLQNI